MDKKYTGIASRDDRSFNIAKGQTVFGFELSEDKAKGEVRIRIRVTKKNNPELNWENFGGFEEVMPYIQVYPNTVQELKKEKEK